MNWIDIGNCLVELLEVFKGKVTADVDILGNKRAAVNHRRETANNYKINVICR